MVLSAEASWLHLLKSRFQSWLEVGLNTNKLKWGSSPIHQPLPTSWNPKGYLHAILSVSNPPATHPSILFNGSSRKL